MATQQIKGTRQLDFSNLVGDITTDGTTLSALKHVRGSASSPSGSDNFAAGYGVGSSWITNAGVVYVCIGDGSWVQTYPSLVSTAIQTALDGKENADATLVRAAAVIGLNRVPVGDGSRGLVSRNIVDTGTYLYYDNGASQSTQFGEEAVAKTNGVSFGFRAGRYLTGGNNVAVGVNCLNGVSGMSTAYNNTGIGTSCLSAVTTGHSNLVGGVYSATSLTEGVYCVVLGANANVAANAYQSTIIGAFSTGVYGDTVVGAEAAATGSYGVAVGRLTSVGTQGVAVGFGASVADGYGTAIGAYSRGTVSGGVSVGWYAGSSLTTATHTTFVGQESGRNTSIGSYGTATGSAALRSSNSGEHNTANGFAALFSSTGSYNTAIGSQAGYSTTGDGSVFVGFAAGVNETGSNKLYVANSGTTTPLIHGDFSAKNLGVNCATYGGGASVLALGSVVTAPTANPTAGVIIWFDEASNSLKYRCPDGTAKTITAA